MSSSTDWVKINRALIESDVFSNPITLKVWIWVLLKATYKDKIISVKTGKSYVDVRLKRGQFLFGRKKAEDALNINESTVYRHIKKLQLYGNITVLSNNHYSVITICKYDIYQSRKEKDEQPEQQPTLQPVQQPKRQPKQLPMHGAMNTNKKDKNIEEIKESKEGFLVVEKLTLFEEKIETKITEVISNKISISIGGEQKEMSWVADLLSADTGISMTWANNGFDKTLIRKGVEMWVIQNQDKKYPQLVDARKHFLFWIPNFSRSNSLNNKNGKKYENNAGHYKGNSASNGAEVVGEKPFGKL